MNIAWTCILVATKAFLDVRFSGSDVHIKLQYSKFDLNIIATISHTLVLRKCSFHGLRRR